MKTISDHAQPEVLEKHKRYGTVYRINELYWGLGVECESYLELSKPVLVKADFMINNHNRERYSVDYYTSYKKQALQKSFLKFAPVKENIPLPVLVNSHALTKTDSQFRHQTLYVKNSPPNPEYSGTSIYELIKQIRPEFFQEKYEKYFTFDGDSIEIITQDFYRTTVKKIIEELKTTRADFIKHLRASFSEIKELSDISDIKWTSGNHGFAVMATNPKNLAIFNNGTYHINITLPTQLDSQGTIQDWPLFIEYHRNLIRYIQWIEPLLVANFGSPDPLAWLEEKYFALGSQRGAMSRYVGLGTYDTNTMPRGKILTVDLSNVKSTWYKKYHETSGYISLEKVGLDINFNKHWNHGVEIRFFDWFPEDRLPGLLQVLVYLGDLAMVRPCHLNPIENPIWNEWMVRVMGKGNEAGCSVIEANLLKQVFGFSWNKNKRLDLTFAELYRTLHTIYKSDGPCSKYFLSEKESQVRMEEVVEVPEVDVGCCCFPKHLKNRENLFSVTGTLGGGAGGGGMGGGKGKEGAGKL